MLGAIIGDIVGSRFEWNNHRNKNFELFTKDCFVTDDSIITLAVGKAIMETQKRTSFLKTGQEYDNDFYALLYNNTIKYMQKIGRNYPNCGYGLKFHSWMFSDNPQPYNSFGNGSAMRVSAAGLVARNEIETKLLSETITKVTHNHEEGLKGAEATAKAIFFARKGFTIPEIKVKMSHYYDLNFKIDAIRDSYKFNETCQDTVPQAIVSFLESESFEDAVRIAISVGGDSDTLAAITCSIAESYYDIPDYIKEKALSYLNSELRTIYDEWVEFMKCRH